MKNFKWLLTVASLACACMGSVHAQSEPNAAENQQAVIKRVLGDFLKSEFDGSEDARQKDAAFGPSSAEAKSFLQDPGALTGQIVDIAADPVEIVKSFTVESVNVGAHGVSANVVFHVLALASSENGVRSISSHEEDETIVYEMAFAAGRWMVFDPPMPRISAGVVVNGLQLHIKGMDSIFKDRSQMSEAQQKTYKGYQDQLSQLNELMRQP
ncbi:hypothetical protein [Dyella acidiphila]|uniref:Uncharacterized protein n=1 Tax=Dyella acidiphila TaxID=2775866 RepID=A0ABR9GE71_9GAMM|nr:hypothetical protein [Dyella acidiphila]MBE1162347.1 hypothetical protein [Dyella acidiphila]